MDNKVNGKEEFINEEFTKWLRENMLHSYKQALEEQGFEELESLTLLTDVEIAELSSAINMKMGHAKKFPAAIDDARKELN
jgi:hypothetical protein